MTNPSESSAESELHATNALHRRVTALMGPKNIRPESRGPNYPRKLTIAIPESLLIEVDEAVLDLRKQRQRVTQSALIEVALRELFRSGDISGAFKRYEGVFRRRPRLGR